jgi:hypothetical protein
LLLCRVLGDFGGGFCGVQAPPLLQRLEEGLDCVFSERDARSAGSFSLYGFGP